jgi:hypothetical protein
LITLSRYKEQLKEEVEKTTAILAKLGLLPSNNFTAIPKDGLPGNQERQQKYQNITIEQCIQDEDLSVLFWTFLKEHYFMENLSFWLEIEDYKKIPDRTILKHRAEEIHEKYFKSGSEYELNVGDDLKQALDKDLKNGATPNAFDAIQQTAWGILKVECFPKFLASDTFSKFKGDILNAAL